MTLSEFYQHLGITDTKDLTLSKLYDAYTQFSNSHRDISYAKLRVQINGLYLNELEKYKIKKTTIPYIPRQVNPDDLDENGFLRINDNSAVAQPMNLGKNKRLNKANYSIIQLANGESYTIYKGVKSDKQLGAGAFGSVKLAQNRITGQWVPLKIMTHQESYLTEVEQLRKAGKLIGHYEYTTTGKRKSPTGAQSPRFAIVMPMAQGEDLFRFTRRSTNQNMSAVRALRIALNLCKTFHEAQQTYGLVHRDIKPDNLMIDNEDKISIIDYGFAFFLQQHEQEIKDPKGYLYGTPGYISPEISTSRIYGFKSDNFAIGVTLVNILFGNYELLDDNDTIKSHNTDWRIDKNLNENTKYKLWELIQDLVNPDKDQRLSLDMAIQRIEAILNQYVEINARTLTVGIFDIQEYQNKSPDEKNTYINALKYFDKVILINTNEDPTKDYRSEYRNLQAELAGKGVRVANQVYSGGSLQEILTAIPQRDDPIESTSIINCYAHVTSSKKASGIAGINTLHVKDSAYIYTPEIHLFKFTDFMFAKTLQNLKTSLQLYESSFLPNKAQIITDITEVINSITQFYQQGNLNYENLTRHLTDLQTKVYSPHITHLKNELDTLIKSQINYQDANGDTALHLAARNNDKLTIGRLIDLGASTTINNSLNQSPIDLAIFGNHLDTAQILFNSINSSEKPKLKSSLLSNNEMLERYLTCGYDPNQPLAGETATPLYYALSTNNIPAANILLKHGANIDSLCTLRIKSLDKKIRAQLTIPLKDKPTFFSKTTTAPTSPEHAIDRPAKKRR